MVPFKVVCLDSLTFLFTDIEGSTALWEQDPETMQSAVARHDAILSDAIDRCGGRIYKTVGDGVCAIFEQPRNALFAAVSLQHALEAESWTTPEPLRVRVAIAVGDAHVRAGDYFGPSINLVARLLSLCRGGQTLLTAQAPIAAGPVTGAKITHHGFYRLKGIEDPVEVAELNADFAACAPPPDSEKAYRVVRMGDHWRPLRDIPNNLVPERDHFIGRESALRELAQLCERKTRLVTVFGTGGIGKTRLVRHFAARWLGEWPGGVYFCDLSEARSLEGIHFAVSMALGVPLGRDEAGMQLGHAIAGRGSCLVILDNFEQVQMHSAATVGRWLDQAAEARFIVTSRERLGLAGEDVFALAPMDVLHDAMALFAARAGDQRPGFAINDANRAVVTEIVRLLDGMPLAIELAAARVRVLSPAQIVERMQDRFALLAGPRGVAARQETLRAAIDWSWALLAPWEQLALAECSVFEGGFTIVAAEAVLHLSSEAPAVIDVIQGLVDKSLLREWVSKSARPDVDGPHFGMYISIHEYAAQKLRALGEPYRRDAEHSHGRYFAGFGSDAAIAALSTHGGVARRNALAMELDNLVAACDRAVDRADADTAAACFLAAFAVLEAQGPFTVAESVGSRVADLAGLAPAQRARVLTALGQAMFAAGHTESADAALLDALASARVAHDRRAQAMSLQRLAVARHHVGRRDEANQHFLAALAMCEPDDRSQRAAVLANLANLQMEQGRMAEAKASYDEAQALHRDSGNRAAEGIALGNLGTLHHDLGQLDEARAAYEGALAIHSEAGSVLQRAVTLGNLGLLVGQQGAFDEAVAHYRIALSIHRDIGNRRGVGVILKQMGQLDHALGDLARAEGHYEEALAIFRDMGNRRFEGGVLDDMGEVMIDRQRPQTALELAERSELIFRDINDPLALAEALSTKGRAYAGLGNAVAAHAALAEAEAIATRLGAKPGSPLRKKVSRLRDAL